MARFNKLDVPYQWKDEFTKYPHGYTIFEALCNWTKQVDNMVDNQNNWNDYLDNFVENFEFELQEEVQSTITRWQNEGLLDDIIESALNTELDNVKTHLAQATQQLDGAFVNVKSFGAIGDGITDDTLAFKSLETFCSGKSGLNIVIPQGTYIISEGITFEISHSTINFLGKIKVKDNVMTPYATIAIDGDNIIINGLHVDGNEANVLDEEMFGATSLLNIRPFASNITFNHSIIENSAYTSVVISAEFKNITFNNTIFRNVGEHCFYVSGRGGGDGLYVNNTQVYGFGMYKLNGRQIGTQHYSGFIKTRANDGIAHNNIVIDNLNIYHNPNSLALYILGSQGLGNGEIKNVYVDNERIYMVSLTEALGSIKLKIENCHSHMFYGVTYHPLDVTLIDCTTQVPNELLSLSAYNTTFTVPSNSHIHLSQSLTTKKQIYHKCNFVYEGAKGLYINNELEKDLTFVDCFFDYQGATGINMIRIETYGVGKLSFINCDVKGSPFRLINLESGTNTVTASFVNCTIKENIALITDGGDNTITYVNCGGQKYLGTTSERPRSLNINKGETYFDTTINKPIWWTGTNWVDYTGTTV